MIRKKVIFVILSLLIVNSTKAEILTVEVTSEHKDGPDLLAVYDKQQYLGKTKARGLHHFEPLYPKVKAVKDVKKIKKNN